MHKEILTGEQVKLLPLIADFANDFGLVGGTAIAFHLGHRRSIDFDLFTEERFGNQRLINKISKREKIDTVTVNRLDELTAVVRGVKLTFFCYPYKIVYSEDVMGLIKNYSEVSWLILTVLTTPKKWNIHLGLKWKMR